MFLFPLGYGGLKRVFASKFVFFSVFPQFSKLWVSNWYHSLVSFRMKNRLGSRSHISSIEAPGIARPFSLEVFFNIADALEIDPADLISASVFPERIFNKTKD